MLQNRLLPTYDLPKQYLPTWESLNSHDVPAWFMDAKFGIFVHWGPYSVPAWAPKRTATGEYYNDLVGNHPYAEIYGYGMMYKDSDVWKHHEETYGKDFLYEDFFKDFKAEKWDPDSWASLFQQAGAKYSVLVTKHSDCYSMFDTKLTDRCCTKTGPMRDITRDFTDAVRKKGMKAGLYYSTTFDWYYRNFPHVIYKQFTHGQLKELIDQYAPDLLWSDDYWKPIEKSCCDTWGSKEIISYFYNHAAAPEEVLTNDRWGCLPDGRQLGDYSTPEYTSMPEIQEFYWEANRGIGRSFGYNREENAEDYASSEELIFLLADIVSKNGNLLLNVGPMANGLIPDLQKERLYEIGNWLSVNGEAIYGTRTWIDAEGSTPEGGRIRFTQKGESVYAMVFNHRGGDLLIENILADDENRICILGMPQIALEYEQKGRNLFIRLPEMFSPGFCFTLHFCKEPHRLLQKKASQLSEGRCGEIFRRTGYLKVNL